MCWRGFGWKPRSWSPLPGVLGSPASDVWVDGAGVGVVEEGRVRKKSRGVDYLCVMSSSVARIPPSPTPRGEGRWWSLAGWRKQLRNGEAMAPRDWMDGVSLGKWWEWKDIKACHEDKRGGEEGGEDMMVHRSPSPSMAVLCATVALRCALRTATTEGTDGVTTPGQTNTGQTERSTSCCALG